MTSANVHDAPINLNRVHDELFTAFDGFKPDIDMESVWSESDDLINLDNYKEYVTLGDLRSNLPPMFNATLQYVEIEDVQSFDNQSAADRYWGFGTGAFKLKEPQSQDVVVIEESQSSHDGESDVDVTDCSPARSVVNHRSSVKFVKCNDVFSSEPESDQWPIVEVISNWGKKDLCGSEIQWTAIQIDDNGFVRPLNQNLNPNYQHASPCRLLKSSACGGQTEDFLNNASDKCDEGTLSVEEWLFKMNQTAACNSSTNLPAIEVEHAADFNCQFRRADAGCTSSSSGARQTPVLSQGFDSDIDVEALSGCEEHPTFVDPLLFIQSIHNYCQQPLQKPSKKCHHTKPLSSSNKLRSKYSKRRKRSSFQSLLEFDEVRKSMPSKTLETHDHSEKDDDSCSDSGKLPGHPPGSQRKNHNALERKRRNLLSNHFKNLRDVIPLVAGNERASKARILQAARDHIERLKVEERLNMNKLNSIKSSSGANDVKKKRRL